VLRNPYLARLLALYAAGNLRGGQVYRVQVAHDDDCPRLRGGDCTCKPDIYLGGKKIEVPES
jgi:hypothetical protein